MSERLSCETAYINYSPRDWMLAGCPEELWVHDANSPATDMLRPDLNSPVVYAATSSPRVFRKGDDLYILLKEEECEKGQHIIETRTYIRYPYGWWPEFEEKNK